MTATTAGFNDLYRKGYAYFEERHPTRWRDIATLPTSPQLVAEPETIARLRTAVFHTLASRHAISRGKPCLQSSTSEWSWSSDPAVEATGASDGLINGNCGFHTNFESDPWWQVDLGSPHEISSVVLYNRLQNSARCNDLDVLLSLDGETWHRAHSKRDGIVFGGLDGRPLRIELDQGPMARFVRVQAIGFTCLHLDQVEVFGRGLEATHDNHLAN